MYVVSSWDKSGNTVQHEDKLTGVKKRRHKQTTETWVQKLRFSNFQQIPPFVLKVLWDSTQRRAVPCVATPLGNDNEEGKAGERGREKQGDDLSPGQLVPLNKAPGGHFITF
jgi:hypothetical protein